MRQGVAVCELARIDTHIYEFVIFMIAFKQGNVSKNSKDMKTLSMNLCFCMPTWAVSLEVCCIKAKAAVQPMNVMVSEVTRIWMFNMNQLVHLTFIVFVLISNLILFIPVRLKM